MNDNNARTRKAAPDERILRFQSLQAGSLFANRYRIIERIGSGEVYRVHDRIAEAEVALKVLYPGSGSSDLERLRRELRLVRELRDPGIVRTHDIGSADGFLFTVSELLNGESLRERLERSAPLPPAKAKTILRGTLSALAVAHAAGVIHRDVKPGNIFLAHGTDGNDERIVLLDFGLARDASTPGLTTVGRFLGTPEYSSPEQVRGDSDITPALGHEKDPPRYRLLRAELFTRLQQRQQVAELIREWGRQPEDPSYAFEWYLLDRLAGLPVRPERFLERWAGEMENSGWGLAIRMLEVWLGGRYDEVERLLESFHVHEQTWAVSSASARQVVRLPLSCRGVSDSIRETGGGCLMKHCPNPDCPHAVSTGRLPEYDDHVDVCADCRTGLVEGPAPQRTDDSVPLEVIAKFSTAHEAHVARAALASHGIDAGVDQDHSPYVSAASWVQLHVAQPDAELARKVLEEGPLLDTFPAADTEPEPVDDMRPMRLSRRILLARWFLYAQAVGGLVAAPTLVAPPVVGLLVLLLAVASLILAVWSGQQPRTAFAAALVYETVLTVGAVATIGPTGLGGLIAVLAVYFAWVAAGDHPPENLLARPQTTRSAEVAIGEAWKVEATAPATAPGSWLDWKRALGIVLGVAVLLVVGTVLERSPLVQKTLRGSTAFELLADPDAAVRQELELGLARLAYELGHNEIDFELLEIVERSEGPGIQLEGTPSARSEAVNDLLHRLFPDWVISGGTHEGWRVQVDAETRAGIVDFALADTLAAIREGLAVTVNDVDRPADGAISLLADIPGERTLDEIRELLDFPARLEMKRVHYPDGVDSPSRWLPPGSREETLALFGGRLPAGTELVPEFGTSEFTIYWPVERIPVVVGRDLLDAFPSTDDLGFPSISFLFTAEAGRRLHAATSQMVGLKMALVFQEEGGASVVSAPVIQSIIGTQGIIQGAFTPEETRLLANRMLAGSRAMPLRVVGLRDERTP